MIMKQIVIVLMIFWIPVSGSSQDNCWPSYRSDAALSGKTNVDLPNSLKLLWTFQTEDIIKSSPVICGKNIFIGSDDGYVY